MIFTSKYDLANHVIEFGIKHYPDIIPKHNGKIILFSKDIDSILDKLYPLYMKYYGGNILLLI